MKQALTPTVQCDLNEVNVSQYACLKELTAEVAKKYCIEKNELEFFNSTESLIDSFFINTVLNSTIKNCYIYSPSFKKYAKSAQRFCTSVRHINRFDNLDFNISNDSLVIFTNPSIPDGKQYDLDEMLAFWKAKNATIFIDEAFLDYCNAKSLTKFINDYDRLYILKSMQHFYSIKGLNMSTLISNKKNITHIKQHEANHKLSVLDTHYFLEVLKDKNFKKINQAITVKNMRLLEEVLKCSDLFDTIYSSNTNMLLCELKSMKAKAFIKQFSCDGLDIKSCESFMFLDDRHVGFRVYSEGDVHLLVQQFQKVYSK